MFLIFPDSCNNCSDFAQPLQVGQGETDGEVLLGRAGCYVRGGQVFLFYFLFLDKNFGNHLLFWSRHFW